MSATKETQRLLKQAILDAQKRWGTGWTRLGEEIQIALVRAEALAVIGRWSVGQIDALSYQEAADRFITAAIQWHPNPIE